MGTSIFRHSTSEATGDNKMAFLEGLWMLGASFLGTLFLFITWFHPAFSLNEVFFFSVVFSIMSSSWIDHRAGLLVQRIQRAGNHNLECLLHCLGAPLRQVSLQED